MADHAADLPDQEIGSTLKVLSDPTRLRIFQLLRRGEVCVCEMAGELDLAENLVSHHLGVLRKARLVLDRRDASDARWVYYQLDPVRLAELAAQLGALFDPVTLGTRTPTCGPVAVGLPKRLSRAAVADRRTR